MEPEKFRNRLFILMLFPLFIACESQSLEEKMLDKATASFQYNQSDQLLEQIDFKGPVIRDRVGNFKPDPRYTVYRWYYIHEKDTFWMDIEVDKKLVKKNSVHLSNNFWDLRDNRKEWSSKK